MDVEDYKYFLQKVFIIKGLMECMPRTTCDLLNASPKEESEYFGGIDEGYSRKLIIMCVLLIYIFIFSFIIVLDFYQYEFKIFSPELRGDVSSENFTLWVMPYNPQEIEFLHMDIEETLTKDYILIIIDSHLLIEPTENKEAKFFIEAATSFENHDEILIERNLYLKRHEDKKYEKIEGEMISENFGNIDIDLSSKERGNYDFWASVVFKPIQKMKEGYGWIRHYNYIYTFNEFDLKIKIPGYERSIFLDKNNKKFHSNISHFSKKEERSSRLEIQIGRSLYPIALSLAFKTVFLSILIGFFSIFAHISPETISELKSLCYYISKKTSRLFKKVGRTNR